MRSKLKNTFAPITDLSEWIRHSFCPLCTPTFRYYESSSRQYGKAISTVRLNDLPRAAKCSPQAGLPFSPEQTRHLCRITSHSPLAHGISPPPAMALSSLMVVSLIVSPSRLPTSPSDGRRCDKTTCSRRQPTRCSLSSSAARDCFRCCGCP